MRNLLLLTVGLILVILALVGIELLPQTASQVALQSEIITVTAGQTPGSANSEPQQIVFDQPPNPIHNFAAAPPWVTAAGVLLCVFAAIGWALFAAHRSTYGNDLFQWRGKPGGALQRKTRGAQVQTPDALLVMSPSGVVFLVGLMGILIVSGAAIFNVQGSGAATEKPIPPAMVMTNQARETDIAHASTAAKPAAADRDEPLVVSAQWPQQMTGADTRPVDIHLSFPNLSQPIPRMPFADRFGQDTRVAVVVTLHSDGLQVKDDYMPDPQVFQIGLDQDRKWNWNIQPYPYTVGPYNLTATIDATLETSDGKQQLAHLIVARPVMVVYVLNPPVPTGPLRLLTLAAALLGSIACIPWLYATFLHNRPA